MHSFSGKPKTEKVNEPTQFFISEKEVSATTNNSDWG